MSKALKAAIEANDPEAVRKALKTVKDPSRKLPGADTPLIHACKCNAVAVIDLLLQAGAMKWKGGYAGEHPFNIAAKAGNSAVIEKLAARGIPGEVPDDVVDHVLLESTLSGRTEVVRVILEQRKPKISHRVLEGSTWWSDGKLFEMLLAHGADIHMQNDGSANDHMRGETALHAAAGSGYLGPIRLLLDHGAGVNAVDQYGRTPLMHLAAAMPRLDQAKRIRDELEAKQKAGGKVLVMNVAPSRRYGDREPGDALDSVRLMLERGAVAQAKDRFGNDALVYYRWEQWRDKEPENEKLVALLKKAGTTGDEPLMDLWKALRADDLAAARAALEAGADPNRDAPPPVSTPPLVMARSAPMVQLLLEFGASASKPGLRTTPLIAAAGSGELEIVKLLIKAGADIHAIEPRPPQSKYVANAWSAADLNRKHEVAAYLKSLGAGNPVLPDWQPMEPGVVVWENFSEIIIKTPAPAAAAALARMIGGSVQQDVYGRELTPGHKTYAILQPKGMAWSNVMRVWPPLKMFEEQDEKFLQTLAREANAPVMLIEYSDAAGASSMKRFEPGGQIEQDQSGDEEALEEMVEAMGDESPEWAKKKLGTLKKEKRPELDVKKLAQQETFVIAWGNLPMAGKKSVEISFTNLPAEAFDGTAWVST